MYFRARHYNPLTGEFLSRDPMEFVDGMSLYRGYFVFDRVDPVGTYKNSPQDPVAPPNPNPAGTQETPIDIDELVATRQAGLFYGGAAETLAMGWTVGTLHNEYKSTRARKHFITPGVVPAFDRIKEGIDFLCQNYCSAVKLCVPISLDIFGYSLGAILGNEVAHHLNATGCTCEGVVHAPVPIRYLGLIDPVARSIPRGVVRFGFFKPANVGGGIQELRSLLTDTAIDANFFPQIKIAGLPENPWTKIDTLTGKAAGYAHGETGNVGGYPVLAGAVKTHLKIHASGFGVQWK